LTDAPTRYADLNDLLARFVDGVTDVLGERLVGMYLVGSFARGDADEYSDVDFLAVTSADVTPDEVPALERLHSRLFELPSHWAQHLDGSYVPLEGIHRKRSMPQRFVYFDNGSTVAHRDEHDDTQVARWVLREAGVPLVGPPPQSFVEPVSRAELRAEMDSMLRSYVEWAPEHDAVGRMSRRKQTYLVTTLCRILLTMDEGRVPLKREALEWGAATVPSRWRSLIERAIADRPDPWGRVHEAASDDLVEETLAFVRWTADAAEMTPRSHELPE
jgi:predicted nucleotidyltransferase